MIDAYTIQPAHAAGEESYQGSIVSSKVTDLMVLAEDLFAVDPLATRDILVDMTVLDGAVAWRRLT